MVELLQGRRGDISLKVDMAEGRSASWSDSEVRALLAIWAEDTVQQELETAKRNKAIFDEISRKLLESDIRRDWKQCRAKIKNLKTLYKKTVDGNKISGGSRVTCKFFDYLDKILGNRPATHPPNVLESSGSDHHLQEDINTEAEVGCSEKSAEDLSIPDCSDDTIDDGHELDESEDATCPNTLASSDPEKGESKLTKIPRKTKKREKVELTEKVMESTMKKFCEYQKESEERFMKWEEERMKMMLEEEKKQREEDRRHEVHLFSLIGNLFSQHKNVSNASSPAQSNSSASTHNLDYYHF